MLTKIAMFALLPMIVMRPALIVVDDDEGAPRLRRPMRLERVSPVMLPPLDLTLA